VDPAGVNRNFIFGRTISTAAVYDGLVYISELEGGVLHCLDARTGEKIWDHGTQADLWGSPYYVDGKIFIGNDDGNLFVFKHGKKDELLTTIQMPAKVRSTPVAVNGVLYVMTDNHLYAIAPSARAAK